MNKSIGLCLLSMIAMPLYASSFFKCTKNNKVVYSQSVCPKAFKQSKIAYHNGITTEVNSDFKESKADPLKTLLTSSTIPHEKLIQLISSEISRLKQEISYNEIIRANELQKIERERFWKDAKKTDTQFANDINRINQHFDSSNKLHKQTIEALQLRQEQLSQHIP